MTELVSAVTKVTSGFLEINSISIGKIFRYIQEQFTVRCSRERLFSKTYVLKRLLVFFSRIYVRCKITVRYWVIAISVCLWNRLIFAWLHLVFRWFFISAENCLLYDAININTQQLRVSRLEAAVKSGC